MIGAWGHLWRGGLIGVAELIPGVSGGSLALLTGVYPLLLRGIGLVGSLSWWRALLRHPRGAFADISAVSLLTLGAGMLVALLLLAPLLHQLMSAYPAMVKTFFIGLLVVGACGLLARSQWRWLALPGLGLAWLTAVLAQFAWPGGISGLFLAGVVAASAMILPGISGALILLLIGYYELVLGYLANWNLSGLAPFICGAIPGVLIIGGLLHRFWSRYGMRLQSLMAGLMLGGGGQLLPGQADPGLLLPLLLGVVCGWALVR